MDNYQATIDRMRCIRRFAIPVMSDDPVPGRPVRHGVNREDYEIIVAGRGCPLCLAIWMDEVRMVCPACSHERSAADFLSGIAEWEDYKRYVQDELENPRRTVTTPMHEHVERIAHANGVRPTYDRGVQRR